MQFSAVPSLNFRNPILGLHHSFNEAIAQWVVWSHRNVPNFTCLTKVVELSQCKLRTVICDDNSGMAYHANVTQSFSIVIIDNVDVIR